MSRLHAIADRLLREAEVLAPQHRADWARGMRAELSAIEGGPAALGWAAGCVATALGWRLRAETYYLGLAVLWFAGPYLYVAAMGLVGAVGLWPQAGWLAVALAQGLPCFVFAAWRPDRAVLAAVVASAPFLPFALQRLLPNLFDGAGHRAEDALFILAEVFRVLVVSACLGWAAGELARRRA